MPKIIHARTITPTLSPTLDNSSYGMTFQDLTVGGESGSLDDLKAALVTFANGWQGLYGANSIDSAGNHASIEMYDVTAHLDGSPAGSPVGVYSYSASKVGGAGKPVPEGDAACLTWFANYGTDVEFGTHTRPRARDRNRCYLGPLDGIVFDVEATTSRTKFTTAFITAMLTNLNTLALVNTGANPEWGLVAWSRKNAAVKPAAEAWMDDRPDYQRRRSDPSTIRTYHALPAT